MFSQLQSARIFLVQKLARCGRIEKVCSGIQDRDLEIQLEIIILCDGTLEGTQAIASIPGSS